MHLILQTANCVVFSVITLLACVYWNRCRDRSHRWFCATVAAILAVTLVEVIVRNGSAANTSVWAERIYVIVLLVFPYSLYRFGASFRAWERWLGVGVAASSVAMIIWSVLLPGHELLHTTGSSSALVQTFLVAFVVYWCAISVLVAVRLWRAGRDEPGVVARRMHMVACAITGISVALLVAGSSFSSTAAQVITQVVVLVSGICFFFGFRPPAVLQQLWRRDEQNQIATAYRDVLNASSTQEAIEGLLPGIVSTLGGSGAILHTDKHDFVWGKPPGFVPSVRNGSPRHARGDDGGGVVVVRTETATLAVATSPFAPFFMTADLEFSKGLGVMIDLAVERERRYEEEQRRSELEADAQLLQRAFLPGELPKLIGVKLAARYFPAKLTAQVGGDWYDAFMVGRNHLGLVVGDVAGKGLPAATLMGRIRNAVWAYFSEQFDPRVTVDLTHRLVEQLESHQLTTLCCAVLDLATRELRWVSAGHLPIMLIRDGHAELLDRRNDPPLGAPVNQANEHHEQLQPGDQLVFYTDGLVERRGTPLDNSLNELVALASTCQGCEIDALIEKLVGGLLPHGSGEDDTVIMAVSLDSFQGRFDVALPAVISSIPRLRRLLATWLDDQAVNGTFKHEILLAVGEATANAVEHAYSLKDTVVHVQADLTDDVLEIKVRDEGHWRKPRGEHRGRGLLLMEGLMDEVSINASEGGTSVKLTKRVDK